MADQANISVTESFVVLLTNAQCDLHTYIAYLVGNRDEARDVLQETNLVLWREASRYDGVRPFLAWAKAVAYYQALSHLKKRSRDRLVFDEELVLLLAESDAGHHEGMQARLRMLDVCFAKLTHLQQSVMKFRYFRNWSVRRLAARFAFSEAAGSMLLTRVRRQLAECIERSLAEEREAGA
jgi:RNA polymerase sigma-70 factor (ECF subfamily)